jgi:hypothetical protein
LDLDLDLDSIIYLWSFIFICRTIVMPRQKVKVLSRVCSPAYEKHSRQFNDKVLNKTPYCVFRSAVPYYLLKPLKEKLQTVLNQEVCESDSVLSDH